MKLISPIVMAMAMAFTFLPMAFGSKTHLRIPPLQADEEKKRESTTTNTVLGGMGYNGDIQVAVAAVPFEKGADIDEQRFLQQEGPPIMATTNVCVPIGGDCDGGEPCCSSSFTGNGYCVPSGACYDVFQCALKCADCVIDSHCKADQRCDENNRCVDRQSLSVCGKPAGGAGHTAGTLTMNAYFPNGEKHVRKMNGISSSVYTSDGIVCFDPFAAFHEKLQKIEIINDSGDAVLFSEVTMSEMTSNRILYKWGGPWCLSQNLGYVFSECTHCSCRPGYEFSPEKQNPLSFDELRVCFLYDRDNNGWGKYYAVHSKYFWVTARWNDGYQNREAVTMYEGASKDVVSNGKWQCSNTFLAPPSEVYQIEFKIDDGRNYFDCDDDYTKIQQVTLQETYPYNLFFHKIETFTLRSPDSKDYCSGMSLGGFPQVKQYDPRV